MPALRLAVGLLVWLALICSASAFEKAKSTAHPLVIKTRMQRRAKWDQVLTYKIKVSNRDTSPLENVHVAVRLPGHGIHYPLEEGVKRGNYSTVHPRKLHYEKVLHSSNTLELWGATLPRKGSLMWRIKIRVAGCMDDPTVPLHFDARAFLLPDGGVPSSNVEALTSMVAIKNGRDCALAGLSKQDGHSSHSYRTVNFHVMHTDLVDAQEASAMATAATSEAAHTDSTQPTATVSVSGVDGFDKFNGIPFVAGAGAPANPVAAAGKFHVVHLVDGQIAAYAKSDKSVVMGPKSMNRIFENTGLPADNPCITQRLVDPTVDYDRRLNRFVASQITSTAPYHLCMAVSPEDDPTGAWTTLSIELSADQVGGV